VNPKEKIEMLVNISLEQSIERPTALLVKYQGPSG